MGEKITLDSNSPEIQFLCKSDKRLAKDISMVGTLTYEKHEDPYALFIHEIVE